MEFNNRASGVVYRILRWSASTGKVIFFLVWLMTSASEKVVAQSQKVKVYGEIGLGAGQTIINSSTKMALKNALGGGFDPNIGNNLTMAFYLAPENWKGLGIGSRIHGTFGTPAKGENSSEFIFNYYNLALSAKYFLFSGTFNKGFYANGSVGFGQFTAKRLDESTATYQHQYAIGTSLMGGIGYTLPFKKYALSFEVQYENANRNGTVNGISDSVRFQSGQIGGNIIFSF